MISLTPPSREDLGQLLESWRVTPLSYSHCGGVESPPERGFIVDEHRVCLGRGTETFSTACHALDGWRMFPAWAEVRRLRDQHPMAGDIVAMQVRICGLWWVNPCRVLRRCDSACTHGFVYRYAAGARGVRGGDVRHRAAGGRQRVVCDPGFFQAATLDGLGRLPARPLVAVPLCP